jgi:hypothetical protein
MNLRRSGLRLAFACLLFLAAGAAFAQPTSGFLTVSPGYPTNHGYIQLPSSSALNFSGGSFTFEAWVAITDTTGSCVSIAGNGFQSSTWIGVCTGVLRSYLRGGGSSYTIGTVPANNWTHIAVTFDAATNVHRHYIDGEEVGSRTEPGGITTSANAWRIFSDANYFYTPTGSIDDVRFWNVARTRDQIRSTINQTLSAPETGLVSVYPLDGNANDVIGGRNGTREGPGGFLTNPVGSGCTTSATQLCVGPGGRFSISATYNTPSTSGNVAQVVTALTTPESGLFWFFGANNWEVMVKLLNGCAINNRKWVFSSATTDQHFELVVTDITHGVTKRYFNYAGAPASAIIDVDAFATCP